jgi:hypothetical protein
MSATCTTTSSTTGRSSGFLGIGIFSFATGPDAGYEFQPHWRRISWQSIGSEPDGSLIELKRDKSSDAVVGQILRYIGWIKATLLSREMQLRLIIAARGEDKLHYRLA